LLVPGDRYLGGLALGGACDDPQLAVVLLIAAVDEAIGACESYNEAGAGDAGQDCEGCRQEQ
jgi:hypothetical protein